MGKITDLSYVNEVAEGDREFLIDITETFIRQVSDFTDNMKRYLSEHNYELLAKEAHTAKSSVILFGLHNLANRLKELQLMAEKKENTETYSGYILEFEDTCNTAISELREELY